MPRQGNDENFAKVIFTVSVHVQYKSWGQARERMEDSQKSTIRLFIIHSVLLYTSINTKFIEMAIAYNKGALLHFG